MNLSNSQKRYLRGLAHAIKPIVMVGNKGITDALIKEFDLALNQHELVKVKLGVEDRDLRKEQINTLSARLNAEIVHSIGKMACYFRRNMDDPSLTLPK